MKKYKNWIIVVLVLIIIFLLFLLFYQGNKSIVGRWKSTNERNEYYYIFNEDSAVTLWEGMKTFSIIFIIGKWHPNLCNF